MSEVAEIVRNVDRLIILKTGEQWTCAKEPQDIDPDMSNFREENKFVPSFQQGC